MCDLEQAAALGLDESSLRLYRWDIAAQEWRLAGRMSNLDGSSGQEVLGPPTDVLGDWGYDPGYDVWANVDHASVYTIAGQPIPEPASLLTVLGGLLLLRRRRPRAAARV